MECCEAKRQKFVDPTEMVIATFFFCNLTILWLLIRFFQFLMRKVLYYGYPIESKVKEYWSRKWTYFIFNSKE